MSDSVHAALKQQAAVEKLSVEALVRRMLAAETSISNTSEGSVTGFAEISQPWDRSPEAAGAAGAPPQSVDLWGALRGTVHAAPDLDLAAPVDATWEAVAN